MSVTIPIRYQMRVDTAANWTSHDPVLLDKEAGYERDTGLMKLGDGATAWSALAYFGWPGASGGGALATYETTAASGGAQSLTLPAAPTWAAFWINGLRQSASLQTIAGTTFDIAAGAGVLAGDTITVDYQ